MIMKYKFLIILFLILISCSEKKEKTVNLESDSVAINSNLVQAPRADSFNMEYNFKLGDVYNYRITTISTTSQEILSDSTITTSSTKTSITNSLSNFCPL